MRSIVGFSFVSILLLLAGVRPIHAQPFPNVTPWYGSDYMTYVLLVLVDAKTERVQDVYSMRAGAPPCRGLSLPSDSTLITTAGKFLTTFGYPETTVAKLEPLSDDLVAVRNYGGDITASAVLHRHGGLVFVASHVWTGRGRIHFPADPLPPWEWQLTESTAAPPQTTTATGVPAEVLATVRKLDIVNEFAKRPYHVTAWHYNREAQPWPLDAKWVVALVRRGLCS